MGSTQQTSNVYSIFCRSEKKVYFRPFLWCFYVYFGVLRVNIDRFESFSTIWGMFKVKKHKFQTKLDLENFRSILFWSENVNSGVKLDTSNLFHSQSNQKDFDTFDCFTHSISQNMKIRLIKMSEWLFSRVWSDRIPIYWKLNEQFELVFSSILVERWPNLP